MSGILGGLHPLSSYLQKFEAILGSPQQFLMRITSLKDFFLFGILDKFPRIPTPLQ